MKKRNTNTLLLIGVGVVGWFLWNKKQEVNAAAIAAAAQKAAQEPGTLPATGNM